MNIHRSLTYAAILLAIAGLGCGVSSPVLPEGRSLKESSFQERLGALEADDFKQREDATHWLREYLTEPSWSGDGKSLLLRLQSLSALLDRPVSEEVRTRLLSLLQPYMAGGVIWLRKPGEVAGDPEGIVVHEGKALVYGYRAIARFDLRTGQADWQTDGLPGRTLDCLVKNGKIFVGGCGCDVHKHEKGWLACCDWASGEVVWLKTFHDPPEQPSSLHLGSRGILAVVWTADSPVLRYYEEAAGALVWQKEAADLAGPVKIEVLGDRIIVASGRGIRAYDLERGAQLWYRQEPQSWKISKVVTQRDRILVGVDDSDGGGFLHAYDLATGAEVWKTSCSYPFSTGLIEVHDSRIFVSGKDTQGVSWLRCSSLETGSILWEKQGLPDVAGFFRVRDEKVFVGNGQPPAPWLAVFTLAEGQTVWEKGPGDFPGVFWSPTLEKNRLFIGGNVQGAALPGQAIPILGGWCQGIDLETGRVLWERKLAELPEALRIWHAEADQIVASTSFDAWFGAIASKTGAILWGRTGSSDSIGSINCIQLCADKLLAAGSGPEGGGWIGCFQLVGYIDKKTSK